MGTFFSPRGPDLGGAELWAGESQPWMLCPRCTSSTCAPRTPHTPASCGWCGKATSPGPSPAASTPGACSASRPPKGWGHPVLQPLPPWHGQTPAPRAAANARLSLEPLPPELGPGGITGPVPLSPLLPARGPAQPLPFLGGTGGGVGPCHTLLGDAAAPNQCPAPPVTGGQEWLPVWVGGCFAKENLGG